MNLFAMSTIAAMGLAVIITGYFFVITMLPDGLGILVFMMTILTGSWYGLYRACVSYEETEKKYRGKK